MQVTAENDDGEDITHCILSMRVGGTEQVCIREGGGGEQAWAIS